MLPSLPLALPIHTVAAAALLLVPPLPRLPHAPGLDLASLPPLQPPIPRSCGSWQRRRRQRVEATDCGSR